MEELLFLGSEITKSADFWPRLLPNPEITMISGPTMDGFYFWRRGSLLKGEIVAQNISHDNINRSDRRSQSQSDSEVFFSALLTVSFF